MRNGQVFREDGPDTLDKIRIQTQYRPPFDICQYIRIFRLAWFFELGLLRHRPWRGATAKMLDEAFVDVTCRRREDRRLVKAQEISSLRVSDLSDAVRSVGGDGHRVRPSRGSKHARVPHLLQPAVGG